MVFDTHAMFIGYLSKCFRDVSPLAECAIANRKYRRVRIGKINIKFEA